MKFLNFKNRYTNDNVIYSKKDIADMSVREAFGRQDEIMAQNDQIGVPSEAELQNSENVVYVHAYTKEDGTEVRAHWRSLPDGDPTNNYSFHQPTNSPQGGTITGGAAELNSENNEQGWQIKNSNVSSEFKQNSVQQNDDYVNESMPEIAGVKCGRPMTIEEAGGNNVNPNYNPDIDNGYSNNCAICNACFSARLLGYNIEALPYDKSNKTMLDLSYHPNNAYVDPKTGKAPRIKKLNVKNAYECAEWLENNINPGEKYALGFKFKDERISHILHVVKDHEGNIVIYDLQRGQAHPITYLNRIDYRAMFRHPIVFRTDDKMMNYSVLNKIAKPH